MKPNFLRDVLVNNGFPARAVDCYMAPPTPLAGPWRAVYDAILPRLGSGTLNALLGNRGTGKTVLASGLGAVVSLKQKRSVRYTTARQLFLQLRATSRNGGATEWEVFRSFRLPDYLVIDEIGRAAGSAWELGTMSELIDARYGDKKDTILISNQEQADFEAGIGDSVVSRLNECGFIIPCNWKSFRE